VSYETHHDPCADGSNNHPRHDARADGSYIHPAADSSAPQPVVSDVFFTWARRPAALVRRSVQRRLFSGLKQPAVHSAFYTDLCSRSVPQSWKSRARRSVPGVLRLLASCNATADDACADCGPLGVNHRWIREGEEDCVLSCDEGFVLNRRSRVCELCSHRCAPGSTPPRVRDNCTHCEACPPKPEKSYWLTQEDRFDCAWECDPRHALVADTCRRWDNVFDDAPKYNKLLPVCPKGHTLVNFKCTPCFEAAMVGAVRHEDLPQPADQDKTWSWIAGCHWQCRHVLAYDKTPPEVFIYTPLRSEHGKMSAIKEFLHYASGCRYSDSDS
jgi:hypothetical protein